MRVLLSIKPVFVEQIFNNTKLFEYRRVIFKSPEIRTIVVYSTKPVGRIVGEFDISGTISDAPEAIWAATSHGAGISKDVFDGYFSGRERGHALRIEQTRKFSSPLDPVAVFGRFTAPQSFMYIGKMCSTLDTL